MKRLMCVLVIAVFILSSCGLGSSMVKIAEKEYKEYENAKAFEEIEPFELESGNYVIGDDIPAGTYDIVVVDGNGNVYTDEINGLNLMMGNMDDDLFIKKFNNAKLKDGATLTVRQVTIKMIPN